MNDKHAAEYSKNCMLGHKVVCVSCINCSYNNIAKGIRLLDKMAIFVLQENFIQVRAFESNVTLI